MSAIETTPRCETCHHFKCMRECWDCRGECYTHHCGDDTCCCLEPEDNVTCDTCHGKGGWFQCFKCHPWDDD